MREDDELLVRVNQRLRDHAGLQPVGSAEARRFRRWELAANIEGAFGEVIDPDDLSPESVDRWRQRLGRDYTSDVDEDKFTDRYWLVDQRAIAGTLGVSKLVAGAGAVSLSSVYVRPNARRTGIARRTLDSVYDAAVGEGLGGIRLDTHWTWQRAVRYYLDRGLWVWSWKHSIGFMRLSSLPRHEFRIGTETLTLLIEHHGAMAPLLVAGRDGDRLVLDETPLHHELAADEAGWDPRFFGRATLALQLAIYGRPLIRSEEAWQQAPLHSDIGTPEGLAGVVLFAGAEPVPFGDRLFALPASLLWGGVRPSL